MRKDQKFSAFAEAFDAIRRAKIEGGALKFSLSLDDMESNAVATLLVATAMLPASNELFDIAENGRRQWFNSDDGSGFGQAEFSVGRTGSKIIFSRNPTTKETTIELPVRKNSNGEHTIKTLFNSNLRDVHTMFIRAFDQDVHTAEIHDIKDNPQINGEYLAFPARTVEDAKFMGKMAAAIAGAHGFDHHVHNALQPTPASEYPHVLVRKEARDAMVAAERARPLPPQGG